MIIKSKLFKNGKVTLYFTFLTGKIIKLKEQEAKELADRINLELKCGAKKIKFIGSEE